jgi:hypothetical protein
VAIVLDAATQHAPPQKPGRIRFVAPGVEPVKPQLLFGGQFLWLIPSSPSVTCNLLGRISLVTRTSELAKAPIRDTPARLTVHCSRREPRLPDLNPVQNLRFTQQILILKLNLAFAIHQGPAKRPKVSLLEAPEDQRRPLDSTAQLRFLSA